MLDLIALLVSTSVQDERDVIRRLKRGDAKALEEAVEAYSAVIFRLIYRIVNDRGVAEDLLQETFIRLWERAHLLDEQAQSIGPWLVTIARHKAFDYAGSRNCRVQTRTRELNEDLGLSEPGTAADEVMAAETVRQVRNALARLSAQQKEVILLAYYEGLSQTEIAEQLRQPLGTVKSRARGALRNMRESMSEQLVGGVTGSFGGALPHGSVKNTVARPLAYARGSVSVCTVMS
jgi:RNA polymerase sigma-70 factor (ECF subfamily)